MSLSRFSTNNAGNNLRETFTQGDEGEPGIDGMLGAVGTVGNKGLTGPRGFKARSYVCELKCFLRLVFILIKVFLD